MSKITRTYCDLCKQEIKTNERYMNAGVYGVECHAHCFTKLDALEVLGFLGIDDIDFEVLGADTDTRTKALERVNYGKFTELRKS